MKKISIILVGLLLTIQVTHAEESINPHFRKFEIAGEKLATSRSLKEIFAQHGNSSRSGNFVLTADGILENNAPSAKTLAALQHRSTLFKLAKDTSILNELKNKNKADTSRLLVQYIQRTYSHERSPLFAFVADLVREHNEAMIINTEALRLISDTACQKGAQDLLQNMNQYKGVLLFFDTLLEHLWEEMIYWFALESYAANPD